MIYGVFCGKIHNIMIIDDKDFTKFIYEGQDSLRKKIIGDDKLLSNMILFVSTGAFALSINFFINNITKINLPIILVISWIFLSTSIMSNSASYFYSRKIGEDFSENINNIIKSNTKELTPQIYNNFIDEDKKSCLSKFVKFLNYIVFISFLLGVIALTYFSIVQII